MFDKMKYIITNGCPIIFNEVLRHDHVAKGLIDVTSAGFVIIKWNNETQRFECKTYGESVSLRLKPLNDDFKIIERMFNMGIDLF